MKVRLHLPAAVAIISVVLVFVFGFFMPQQANAQLQYDYFQYLPLCVKTTCAGPLVSDDFSNPSSGWYHGDDGTYLYGYESGEYRMWLRPSRSWMSTNHPDTFTDFVAVVDVRSPEPAAGGYGLAFGMSSDLHEMYTFEISPISTAYTLWKYQYGLPRTALRVSTSAAILPNAPNRLVVFRSGNLIYLYANGVLVYQVEDSSYTGVRHVGLSVTSGTGGGLDARFDNFAVYPPGCLDTVLAESQ